MPAAAINYQFNIATSLISTVLRVGVGVSASPAKVRPEKFLELYDFEGCPHCRLVREVLTELDLDAIIYPCPKRGERFRPRVIATGGKAQFPYLIDPNTGREMYESADIIHYLFETYAQTTLPLQWRLVELQRIGSTLASLPRMGSGTRVRASRVPQQHLELYSFESSPFARPVRDLLCELEISYVLRSVGRTTTADWLPPGLRDTMSIRAQPETINRRALLERAGRVTVPYLVDPNSATELGDSAEIIEYLQHTYAQ